MAENEQQFATEAKDAETEQSTAHDEELEENEPNAEAPLSGSEASYGLSGGRLHQRPKRTIRQPKHLANFVRISTVWSRPSRINVASDVTSDTSRTTDVDILFDWLEQDQAH